MDALDAVAKPTASLVRPVEVDKIARFKEITKTVPTLIGQRKLLEASKLSIIAADIVRTEGQKIFNGDLMAALKAEWGLYYTAYKYDQTNTDARTKANALYEKIKAIESAKPTEKKGK